LANVKREQLLDEGDGLDSNNTARAEKIK